ncbi:MAG: Rieske 2Fe-2S domain-containing protein [Myxococcota bacterium]
MIPNRGYPIASSQVRSAPVALRRMGLSLVVFGGDDGALRSLRERCPHRGAEAFPLREEHGLVWLWWAAPAADGRVPTEGGDKLVRADVGTARYLRLRRRLLREAAATPEELPPHVRAALPEWLRPVRSLPVLDQVG